MRQRLFESVGVVRMPRFLLLNGISYNVIRFTDTPLNPPFQGGLPGLESVFKTSSPAPERGGGQGEGFGTPFKLVALDFIKGVVDHDTEHDRIRTGQTRFEPAGNYRRSAGRQ